MTANQISYKMAQETERTNQANEGIKMDTLAESVRHNQAMEALNQEANDLTRERNNMEAYYKEQQLMWQREIEQQTLNLNKAQGDERNRIQAQIAHSTEQLNLVMEDYYDQKRLNESMLASNTVRQTEEIKRHNTTQEQIDSRKVEIDAYLRGQDLEYKNRALETESGLRAQEIQNVQKELQRKETNDILTLGLARERFELESKQMGFQNELLKAQTANTKSQKFWRPWGEITHGTRDLFTGFNQGISGATDIIKLLGGL